MNNIVIHGRLSREPWFKRIATKQGGQIGCSLINVATDRKAGDETEFIDCISYGRTAEAIYKWLHTGDGVVISGELQHDKGRGWRVLVEFWEFAEKSDKTKAEAPPDFDQISEALPWE